MTSLMANEKAKKMLLFSVAVAALMALVFLLASSLKDKGDTGNNTAAVIPAVSTAADKLISVNANLQQQITVLQQLDGQFAAAVTDTAFSVKADSLNTLILAEENRFKNAVETAGGEVANLTEGTTKTSFEKMLTAYRLMAESRQSTGMLRNMSALKSNDLAPGEKQLLSLQNEVMEKSNRIATLEMALGQIKNTKPVLMKENTNNAELQQHIANLENKLSALNTLNNGLKQDNDRLQQVQANMHKTAGSAEQVLKEKNTSLQQRIDDLTAEIQLVKVDCNLNRVDATQIISNAKQRRQLLNEASDMLTNLSVSGNADVNRKVKEKINRLNQVAGNYRE